MIISGFSGRQGGCENEHIDKMFSLLMEKGIKKIIENSITDGIFLTMQAFYIQVNSQRTTWQNIVL